MEAGSMVGKESSAAERAEVSAAAEAMMASAAAWSLEEGAGAPMVVQLFVRVLRMEVVEGWWPTVGGGCGC